MSLAKKILWNTGIQVTGKVLSTILGIWLIILMTRSLGAEGFGAYTTANTYLQFFALFLDMGLNVTLVALLGEHADDQTFQKRCVSALFTLRVMLAIIILFIIAPISVLAFPYAWEIKMAVFALSASFIFPSMNQVVIGAQQKVLKLESAAIAEVLGRIISIVGILLVIHYNLGLLPMMWVISFSSLVLFTFNIYHARKDSSFAWNWDPAFWKMALKRSWPVGVTILLGLFYFKADTFILSLTRSQAEVGLYGAAYRVFEVLITIPFMYAGIILPILSNAWKKDQRESFSKLISHSIDGMVFLAVPIVFGSILLGEKVLVAISGPEFIEAGRALSILSFAIAVTFINVVFSHAVIAIDAQRKMIPPYLVVSTIAVIAYSFLIPRYGLWAAAWLTVLFETLILMANIVVTHRAQRINYKPKVTALAFIACIPMTAVILALRHYWIGIPVIAGGATYLITALVLGAAPKQLIADLKQKNTVITP